MQELISACLDRCTEDVSIQALIIPKFKLVNVEMQILLADLVERANDPALHDGPKAFDGIGMNSPDDVLPPCMIDDLVRILFIQLPVAHPLIGDQQTDLVRDGFVHEAGQRVCLDVCHDSSHHVALTLHGSGNDRLPRSCTARATVAVVPVPVLGLAADECFIGGERKGDRLLNRRVSPRYQWLGVVSRNALSARGGASAPAVSPLVKTEKASSGNDRPF